MELTEIQAMKVVDLKLELDKRNLPKTGAKATLVDRLYQCILKEKTDGADGAVPLTVEDDQDFDEWEDKPDEEEMAGEGIPPEDLDESQMADAGEPTAETKSVEDECVTNKPEDSSALEDANDNAVVGESGIPDGTVGEEAANIEPVESNTQLVEESGPLVPDNQNFDNVENTEVDNSLLNDEDGTEELDFGDGDDHKEDVVSFQIEESDKVIVETEKKEADVSVKTSGDVDSKGESDSTKDAAKQDKDEEGHPDILKMIWVSNLTKMTRALDLKTCFGLYGKVMSAKVVMNPNAKEAKCFGLVTMSRESEAETAIEKLNGYKLHDKEIVTSRPKKDNAVLRKMRQQLPVKTSSRPAGIRPRQDTPDDPEKSSTAEKDSRERRIVSGSGANISVNIKSDDKGRRSSPSRRRRTRSRSSSRKRGTSSKTSPPKRQDRPRSPRRRRSRSPRRRTGSPKRKSRSPKRRSKSPRRKSKSPPRPERTIRRSPIRPPSSPKRVPPKRSSPRKRSPHHRASSPRRRSPRRSPAKAERRRGSRSPKRPRRSNSRDGRRRSSPTDRRSARSNNDKELELKLLREQTAKQEAAIKALMQGNIQNLGGVLGESLTEKLAADLKSALVKQLQSTVKTMSSKSTSKAAMIEAQNAANAAKIKENLEKMKASGQVPSLITNQARPSHIEMPPMQSLPTHSSAQSVPSFNPLMVAHKSASPPIQTYSSQRSSSRDNYSRSSHDQIDHRSYDGGHSSNHPGGHSSSHTGSSSHSGNNHPGGSSHSGNSHSSGSSHNYSSSHSTHSGSRDRNMAGSSSRSSRSDTYSGARAEGNRSNSGQQSSQINDLLKSLQGVKEMVNKPNNAPQPNQQQTQNIFQKQQPSQPYKSNPLMQPPLMPYNQPPAAPQQFHNANLPPPPPMNFNPQGVPPVQWGAAPRFNAGAPPPFMNNNPNPQFRR